MALLRWDPWLYYECCGVLEKAPSDTPCWYCGEGKGVDYYDTFMDVPIEQKPFHQGTSQAHVSFHQVSTEALKWRNP